MVWEWTGDLLAFEVELGSSPISLHGIWGVLMVQLQVGLGMKGVFEWFRVLHWLGMDWWLFIWT